MNIYSITTYRKLLPYDNYLHKRYIHIGYNYSIKGPSFVWYRLYRNSILKPSIKKRIDFYPEPNIHYKHRSYNSNYYNSGYDRGHLAPDSSFDDTYDKLHTVYTLANVIPQRASFNRKGWLAAERYSKLIALKYKYCYVLNIVLYINNNTILNDVGIPDIYYKIIINNKQKFIKIFRFMMFDNSTTIKDNVVSPEYCINELKKYK